MSQYANRHSIEWELQASLKMEAAEDMYEALKWVRENYWSCMSLNGQDIVAAAIAKAEGKS